MKTLSPSHGGTIPVVKRTPSFLLQSIRETEAFRHLLQLLETGQARTVAVNGLNGSLASLVGTLCSLETGSPLLVFP